MKRAQNCHAMVNAGFLVKFQKNSTIVEMATICAGGISPEFVHAKNTEQFFIGKDLFTTKVLQFALQSLENELNPDSSLSDASPEYRQQAAMALFYRFVLSSSPAGLVSEKYLSGGQELHRGISTGSQSFQTIDKEFPITEPIPKLEALSQTSGEAKYIGDMPHQKDQLWAAFVSATKVNAIVAEIDASEALALDGVRHFYAAKDIPGKNSFTPLSVLTPVDEEIFIPINGEVLYNGQPVGVICADTITLAIAAAALVKIVYENSTII